MENSFKIKGTLQQVLPTVKIKDDLYKKVIIIEYMAGADIERIIAPTIIGDQAKLEKLNEKLNLGKVATFHFNLKSREYNGKYFHDINIWRIETEAPTNNSTPTQGAQNDLPF